MSRWIKYIIFSGATLLIAGLSILGYDFYQLFYKPMLVETQVPVIIQIDKATGASSFANNLKNQNLIKSTRLLLSYIRMKGLASKLKAGIYQVQPGESVGLLLDRVIAGDVLVQSFSIIEGMTQNQISARLKQAPYLNYQESDWLPISNAFSSAEGMLLADTYYYDAGSDSKSMLARAHYNLLQYLEQSWKNRDQGLPYKSSYELLITASILEKETALPQERRLIAGVIVNRLKKNMPLQMDPTVIYGLGAKYTGSLSHEDMQIDSPYNSYRYRGLPPTPIAMVSKEAIDAAAHPQQTAFLYFVSRGDGSHQFSVTYDQQRQAIDRYLRNANAK